MYKITITSINDKVITYDDVEKVTHEPQSVKLGIVFKNGDVFAIMNTQIKNYLIEAQEDAFQETTNK